MTDAGVPAGPGGPEATATVLVTLLLPGGEKRVPLQRSESERLVVDLENCARGGDPGFGIYEYAPVGTGALALNLKQVVGITMPGRKGAPPG